MTYQSRARLDDLRAYLNAEGAGGEELRARLADVWQDLEGSGADAMEPRKVERIEQITWEEPVLTFAIERHGGTAQGSSRTEVQRWRVDLEAGTADAGTHSYRQLVPQRPRLDVKSIAVEIAEKMNAGLDDPALQWSADRKKRARA